MRIALVSQPYDRITPPNQNSVGLCTYALSKALRKHCEVVSIGLKDRHEDVPVAEADQGAFCFVPSQPRDRFAVRLRSKVGKLVPLRSPISTSGLLYPGYGWQVAQELKARRCDVIHIQL